MVCTPKYSYALGFQESYVRKAFDGICARTNLTSPRKRTALLSKQYKKALWIFSQRHQICSKKVIQGKLFYFKKHPKNKVSWLRPILGVSLLVKLTNPLGIFFVDWLRGTIKNKAPRPLIFVFCFLFYCFDYLLCRLGLLLW